MVGGGIKGNVPPGTIVKAVTTISPRLKKTSNEQAANGGMDIESVQDAAARAPRQFRSMDRAVTTQDSRVTP